MEWIYKYFSLTAVIAGSWFLIRYLIQKKVDSYFNKRLETYKHELAIITENAKYDISKKMFDFEAYASKKHVVYPELYHLALEPLKQLSGFRYHFDADLKISPSNLDDNELLAHFYGSLGPIRRKLLDAYNYFHKNELYLSQNASASYDKALEAQAAFIKAIEQSFHSKRKIANLRDPDFWLIEVDDEVSDEATKKLNVLKEIIYKELSYTHFEEPEKK